MRDPKPAGQAGGDLLVELGGWFDHLAAPEVAAVSQRRAVFVAPRLALVAGTAVDALVRLGTGGLVHAELGWSHTPRQLPERLVRALTGSYAIRFRDAGRRLGDADRRSIISAIWRSHPNPRVDLDHPEQDLHVYATDHGLWFGQLLAVCDPSLRADAERRPFVRSYEMPPRKARVFVNMCGVRPGMRFLDPFCGTGSLVLEAARIGCTAYGADLEIRACMGASRNAAFQDLPARFVAADVQRLPIQTCSAFDGVAADLPYGRSARRRAVTGRGLYVACLEELRAVVAVGARAVLVSLVDDLPREPPQGWALDWSCIEHARTVDRSVAVWRAV